MKHALHGIMMAIIIFGWVWGLVMTFRWLQDKFGVYAVLVFMGFVAFVLIAWINGVLHWQKSRNDKDKTCIKTETSL